jgi:hypothetical protein
LKLSEEFEEQMTERTQSYAEKFNAERSKPGTNPFK